MIITIVIGLYLLAGFVCAGLVGIDSTIARTSTLLGGLLVFGIFIVFWPLGLLAFCLEDMDEEEGI